MAQIQDFGTDMARFNAEQNFSKKKYPWLSVSYLAKKQCPVVGKSK